VHRKETAKTVIVKVRDFPGRGGEAAHDLPICCNFPGLSTFSTLSTLSTLSNLSNFSNLLNLLNFSNLLNFLNFLNFSNFFRDPHERIYLLYGGPVPEQ
jgi:hypothetical protein